MIKIHSEPFFNQNRLQICNWVNEANICIIQERTRFPKPFDFSNNIVTRYWIGDFLYTDEILAEKDAKQFDFFPQLGFYCDKENPHWFPIFADFDKALAFLKKKTGIEYVSE